MRSSIDELIIEFNRTIGLREGIIIETAFVAVAMELHEKLLAAASGDPGAPELPDIAIIYPRAAITLAEKGILMDFREQFNNDELSQFVKPFLDEGTIGGTLYILPVAKSTEVLYVNTTIFDRFSRDTGVNLSQLITFEGLFDAAEKYYAWIDAQTPDLPHDGKAFFFPQDQFNHAFAGFGQLGYDFVLDEGLNLYSAAFERIWDSYYPHAVKGRTAIFNRYATSLFQSGEIVTATGTSASVVFLPSSVTYADNTREEANFAILPYPVFEGGQKLAVQRGGGFCVFRSNAKNEYASGVFLKWLTSPQQNLRFTTRSGYLPVTEAAYGDFLAQETESITNENLRNLFRTILAMQADYVFIYPRVFDGFEELQNLYNAEMLRAATEGRREYRRLLLTMPENAAFEAASHGARERFIARFRL